MYFVLARTQPYRFRLHFSLSYRLPILFVFRFDKHNYRHRYHYRYRFVLAHVQNYFSFRYLTPRYVFLSRTNSLDLVSPSDEESLRTLDVMVLDIEG